MKESTKAHHLSTGVMGAACVHRTVRNMGDLEARGQRPNTHRVRVRGAPQESEGPKVPMKRSNFRGGTGP